MNFLNFKVNIQNIEHETPSSVCFKMPKKSKYAGFTFWLSKKLIKDGSHSYELSCGVGEDFIIKLKRTSKKTFKTLSECEITAKELVECFQ
ncbi:hypothetical protein C1Z70_07545 [Campylobacter jejuni]|nr:hypothetical protein [Campylobacter jejuni]